MTVEEFNTEKGLYIFKLDNVETGLHSHPAVEIIIAEHGVFTFYTENAVVQDLKFAIVEANRKHGLSSVDCKLKVIMIEHHNRSVKGRFASIGIEIEDGYYFRSKLIWEQHIINEIVRIIIEEGNENEYDGRISATIQYLNSNSVEYRSMIETLQKVTNLSESRLSHLFKSSIGVSLKKYLIWTKLKSTVKQHLNSQDDLFTALIHNGFYDQPHFSKNFKAMLGIKPSTAYNSRNVQVLTNAGL